MFAISWIDEADKGANGEHPELALLDIRLPGNVKGPDVGARIRQSPVLNGMAIVMITAYKLSTEEEQEVMKTAGADRLLNKPLPNFGELKKLLEEAIAERRAKMQAASAPPPTDTSTPANNSTNTNANTNTSTTSSTSTPGTKKNANSNAAAEPVHKEK
jgi:CheY-like chemotaxis protein